MSNTNEEEVFQIAVSLLETVHCGIRVLWFLVLVDTTVAACTEERRAGSKGYDAVVSAVGNKGFLGQKLFIDAVVKKFRPSEFGSLLATPKAAALPVSTITSRSGSISRRKSLLVLISHIR